MKRMSTDFDCNKEISSDPLGPKVVTNTYLHTRPSSVTFAPAGLRSQESKMKYVMFA